jgi:hydrogenase 3 maturation protease
MLRNCWKEQLDQRLKPLAEGENFRLAILGIGNELNGDDSAGVLIARKLLSAGSGRPNLLVLDCGTIPENASGPLRKFRPDLILMIDVADLGLKAGAILEVDLQQVRGFSASSHSLPLNVLSGFLKSEFNCETALFCIQPQTLEYCAQASDPVQQAVQIFVSEILRLLGETKS